MTKWQKERLRENAVIWFWIVVAYAALWFLFASIGWFAK